MKRTESSLARWPMVGKIADAEGLISWYNKSENIDFRIHRKMSIVVSKNFFIPIIFTQCHHSEQAERLR